MSLLALTADYFVAWANYGERVRVLNYDRVTGTLTPTPEAAGLVEIESSATEWGWKVDGEYALFMNADGRLEAGLITTQIQPLEFPRLEFVRDLDSVPEVLAAVSKTGRFSVRDVREDTALPGGTDQFAFFGKISIGPRGLVATEIREIGLLTEPSGNYLSNEAAQLLET